jgi:rhamnose transport system ATP-binding protein
MVTVQTAPSQPVLVARGITKSFGPVTVLREVDFDLRPGEVHTLMGENGAGKSTLLKILGGIHRADTGDLLLDQKPLVLSDPRSAQRHGIALIHQEPLTFPDLDVAENILLGHGQGSPLFSLVNWRRRYQEAGALLASLGVQLDPRAKVFGLSIADQQMVEMAGALSQKAKILLMDEPTASLTPDEVRQLFRIVRRLREQGTAIVFISHRLEEVFEISDRITVLRDGEYVATRRREETDVEEIIRMMVGRSLSAFYEKEAVQPGETLLEVKGLARAGRFDGIDLEVRAGEIVGLAGLVGAGRTDVGRALFGVAPATGGEIRVKGKAAHIRSPADAIRLGIALVPEDRQQHGLLPPFSIAQNTSAASLNRMFPKSWIHSKKEANVAETYRGRLNIASRDVQQATRELSGGNQQKVVLAKWLHTNPDILILDEPTRGIDIGAKQEVHHLMNELSRQGKAIVLISSDLPEILAMSDRIVVLREGRITGRFTRGQATQEKIMAAATGQLEEPA